MITHLLDTDVCIVALKKRDQRLLEKLKMFEQVAAVSSVSVYELYFGAEGYEDAPRRKGVLRDFLGRFPILAFDTAGARRAAEIRFTLETAGKGIGSHDTLIAATALEHDLTLISGNIREFSRIKGLKQESWR